jgi:aspartate carbamoyltransferase catalytic subunit
MSPNRHIIESQQFTPESIIKLFELALRFERGEKLKPLEEKIVATLFYEPSTRTRLSFESAVLRLGGKVISTENAKEFSSASKGETIEDTIRVIGGYVDAIVLRHYEVGAARRASLVSPVPIINAGDGVGQHPTQALLDAYTIYKRFGRLNNLTIQFIGDLANGRTVRSLVYLLSKFPNNRFIFVSPKILRMRDDILEYLIKHQIDYIETEEIQTDDVDVNYITRIQKERFGDNLEVFESVFGKYVIDNELADKFPITSIIMHPLPRVNEISTDVDSNLRAVYFKQAKNGLYVRMAILDQVVAEESFLFAA